MAKRQTNEEKIVAALDALDGQVRKLQKFGAGFDAYIDEAGMRNNRARVVQLIKQKKSVYAVAEQLSELKSNLMLGASYANIAQDLNKLPAAIAGCKGLLTQTPDFGKMSKNIEKIFKDIQGTTNQIAELNGVLDKVVTPQDSGSLSSRLDGTADAEESDWFKAEYAAMLERIKGRVATSPVSVPNSETDDITGDNIDIAGIISDENKKK